MIRLLFLVYLSRTDPFSQQGYYSRILRLKQVRQEQIVFQKKDLSLQKKEGNNG